MNNIFSVETMSPVSTSFNSKICVRVGNINAICFERNDKQLLK